LRSTSEKRLRLQDVRVLAPSRDTHFYWAKVTDLPADRTELIRGTARPLRPALLEVERGGRPGDFVWNSHSLVVASPNVLNVLEESRFRGYSTYPVVVRVKDRILAGYCGIAVTGRAGPVDFERSRVRWFTEANGSRGGIMAIDGLYFHPENWDGSDIFCVDEFLHFLMVKRVRDALRSQRVTNFTAKPLQEFGFGPEGYPPRSVAKDAP